MWENLGYLAHGEDYWTMDSIALHKDVLTLVLISLLNILQEEVLNMRALLSQCFLPDDEYPSGAPLFLETPQPCSPVSQIDFQSFDEVICFI